MADYLFGFYEPISLTCRDNAEKVMLTGQLGQVHCPEGQLQVPVDEQPQSLMMKVGCEL
jgi:hypothetical protein